jgi:hypothetical protein
MTPVHKLGNVLFLVFMMGSAFATGRAGAQELEARHIERTASFQLEGTLEEVIKLLEPRGRPLWVKSWQFVFLFPPSGDAQPGAVIRQVHRSGAVEQIWLLSEYDPPTRIKYVIFVAGMETWEFDTRLKPGPDGKTMVTVEHRITSLAEEVNREVQSFADGFDRYVERVQSALNTALEDSRK